ncbi:MAG: DNA mismatch repair protein, partial [Bacteroidota bacterium]
MDFYILRKELFLKQLTALKNSYNLISIARMAVIAVIITLGYFSVKDAQNRFAYIWSIVAGAVIFILLMNRHNLLSAKKKRAEAIVVINQNEITFLENRELPFDNGTEFINTAHPYSYDLDIFGNRSLFHNLNRTYTYKGKQKLANLLLTLLPNKEIIDNQEAIKELAAEPEWRQEIMAQGKVNNDSEQVYSKLMAWQQRPAPPINLLSKIIAIVSPALFAVLLVAYIITGINELTTYMGYVIAFNVCFMLFQVKKITPEIKDTTDVSTIIKGYAEIITKIENQEFKSEKLNRLKTSLTSNNIKAGSLIKKLGILFSQMDSISNVFAAAVLNGLFLYHFHIFNALANWKKKHGIKIADWLDVVAETEALSSIANMYYNNPDFCFPQLNTNHEVNFNNVSHPLLKRESRVGNDITFNPAFTILTGSNMSGKSTFLRSLGINMVLAGCGSPVCAKDANIHPLPVLVSMRLSDSLSDSESYFFAEIKRLKEIMDALQTNRAFVLLDEILRGTNSDDKQMGTIKVIEKMVAHKAIGA